MDSGCLTRTANASLVRGMPDRVRGAVVTDACAQTAGGEPWTVDVLVQTARRSPVSHLPSPSLFPVSLLPDPAAYPGGHSAGHTVSQNDASAPFRSFQSSSPGSWSLSYCYFIGCRVFYWEAGRCGLFVAAYYSIEQYSSIQVFKYSSIYTSMRVCEGCAQS